jgi:hypothetical protein
LPQQWKESIIIPIHKKCDKTDCNIYRGISLLLTAYKILSNILLDRLTPYVSEIIGDHQCGFHRNRSTTELNSDGSGESTVASFCEHGNESSGSIKKAGHSLTI